MTGMSVGPISAIRKVPDPSHALPSPFVDEDARLSLLPLSTHIPAPIPHTERQKAMNGWVIIKQENMINNQVKTSI